MLIWTWHSCIDYFTAQCVVTACSPIWMFKLVGLTDGSAFSDPFNTDLATKLTIFTFHTPCIAWRVFLCQLSGKSHYAD